MVRLLYIESSLLLCARHIPNFLLGALQLLETSLQHSSRPKRSSATCGFQLSSCSSAHVCSPSHAILAQLKGAVLVLVSLDVFEIVKAPSLVASFGKPAQSLNVPNPDGSDNAHDISAFRNWQLLLLREPLLLRQLLLL